MARVRRRVGGGGGCLFQAEDGIRDLVRSRGLGDVYKRQQNASTRRMLGRAMLSCHTLVRVPVAPSANLKVAVHTSSIPS